LTKILTTAEISDAFYYGTGVKLVHQGITQEIFDLMTLAVATKELNKQNIEYTIQSNSEGGLFA